MKKLLILIGILIGTKAFSQPQYCKAGMDSAVVNNVYVGSTMQGVQNVMLSMDTSFIFVCDTTTWLKSFVQRNGGGSGITGLTNKYIPVANSSTSITNGYLYQGLNSVQLTNGWFSSSDSNSVIDMNSSFGGSYNNRIFIGDSSTWNTTGEGTGIYIHPLNTFSLHYSTGVASNGILNGASLVVDTFATIFNGTNQQLFFDGSGTGASPYYNHSILDWSRGSNSLWYMPKDSGTVAMRGDTIGSSVSTNPTNVTSAYFWAHLPSATGTVTSVGATVPTWDSIVGSPITSSGTLAISSAKKGRNLFLASPTGATGLLSARKIFGIDLPPTSDTANNVSSTGTAYNVKYETGNQSSGNSSNFTYTDGTSPMLMLSGSADPIFEIQHSGAANAYIESTALVSYYQGLGATVFGSANNITSFQSGGGVQGAITSAGKWIFGGNSSQVTGSGQVQVKQNAALSNVGGTISASYTASGVGANTTPTILNSIEILANSLSVNGQSEEIEFYGQLSTSTGTKTISFLFGSNGTTADSTFASNAETTTLSGSNYIVDVTITRVSNTQVTIYASAKGSMTGIYTAIQPMYQTSMNGNGSAISLLANNYYISIAGTGTGTANDVNNLGYLATWNSYK